MSEYSVIKIKYTPIILLGALLLSCGEQKKQREVEWSSVEVEESRDTVLVQDTVQTAASAPEEDVKPAKVQVSSSGSVRSSSKNTMMTICVDGILHLRMIWMTTA